jgi:membrane-associated protease RseP (regulator of RpoE activity)
MIKSLRPLLAFALVAAGPSADDQPTLVVRALLQQDIAVATIGYRLATANVDLCVEHMVDSGMLIETLGQYGAAFRPAARQVLGLRDGPTVALVVAGSPAERAGLKPGDVLVDADGAPFAATPPASADGRFAGVEAAMTALDAALADGKARLTIARNGQRLTVDLIGITACKARFQLVPGDYADAVANGTWVQLSTRMAGFATTPDELAAILGHELAHNALGHRKAKAKVQRLHELQADRLMPYLMARAGFDPGAAVMLWRRFEARRLGGLFPSATHPSWSDRVRAVEIERTRIAGLVSRGATVVPPDDLTSQ